MLPVLQIGPLSIQTPGLALLLALWLGLSLAERHAPKRGLRPDTLYNLVFIALVSGVLGGRLVYVLQYPQAFLQNPVSLVSLNPGLFDPAGGLAAGLLAGLVYGQRKTLDYWKTLDALTPLLAVTAVGIALAHLTSGEAFGAPSRLPWALDLWGTRRHPSQVYELLGSLLTLGLLWPRKADSAPGGAYFLRFAALTSGLRLFLEAFRGDSTLVFGGLRLAQIAAWLALAAALGLLAWREKPNPE
jgi:prolipoprotein diacylglyceryltransferase